MTRNGSTAHAVLAVHVDRREQTSELTAILHELAIPSEVLEEGSGARPIVLVRIPASQVQEAILALGLRGFSEVRVYGGRE